MATDATGTPTSPDSIPTYNTAADSPSGVGANNIVAAIQTALSARIPKTLTTTTGDLIYASSANTPARLGIGSTGQVLAVVAGVPAWSSAAGAFVQLSDTLLGSDTASFDISSISGAYNHLKLVIQARTTEAVVASTLAMRFNNDSGANYDWQRVYGLAATATSAETLAATSLQPAFAPGASATANNAAAVEILIPNYAATTFNKNFVSMVNAYAGTGTGTIYSGVWGGGWRSTAAINRITILPGGGSNLKTGSRLTIYGML